MRIKIADRWIHSHRVIYKRTSIAHSVFNRNILRSGFYSARKGKETEEVGRDIGNAFSRWLPIIAAAQQHRGILNDRRSGGGVFTEKEENCLSVRGGG